MRSFKRRRFARAWFSLVAVLSLMMIFLGAFAPGPVTAQTASITINNHTCAEDISTYDINAIAAACQGSDRAGFTYTVELQTVGVPPTFTATTDDTGLLGFSGLDEGTWYIYRTPNPNYAGFRVFCSIDDFLGNNLYPYFEPPTATTEVGLFNEGDMAYCDFFNYNAAPAPTTGTVSINKITCPEGFDGYSADVFDLAANCQDATQVVNFSLTDVNGATSTATTPGTVVNFATFANVPTGTFSVTEEPLPGYGQPRVFCKNQRIVGQSESSAEVTVTDTTAEAEFKPGYDDVYCDWFNIAYTPNRAIIIINKYACPEGYLSDSQPDLSQNCQEPYDPVTFKLDGASSGNPGDQETGSVIPNGVRWSDLDGDTWYITEFLPDGYGQPIVFCKLISNDDLSESPLEQVPVEVVDDGVRIVYDVAELYTLSCEWYNVTDTPYSGVYIHKYGCPTTYEQDWSLDEWVQYCTTIVRGAYFSLDYPDGSTDEQPVNGIDVFWELLPPGEYRISERQPAAWSESAVYCSLGSYNGDQAQYSQVDISSNAFSWELGPYEYIDCYWFNLPKPRPVATVDPNAPATLTIIKYTCPEDYDPLGAEADPAENCDDLTDGIAFSVIGSQNASLDGETGDDGDGTVTFDGLKAGSYLVRETYPEDTVQAFIWSCESDYRIFDYPFTPFARIDRTGTIGISMIAGETLECSWFNVPSPPEEEATPGAEGEVAVTIRVYQCSAGLVNLASCDDPVGEGIGISLSESSGGGGPIDFETDQDSVATGSVAPGEYDIDADEPICLGSSDAFTPDNTLVFEEGGEVEVVVGLCG